MKKIFLLALLHFSFQLMANENINFSDSLENENYSGEITEEEEVKDLIFWAMKNFKVERKNGKVRVGFDYVIENPNWFSVVIMPSSLFLKIAGTDCGWVKVEEKIKVKRKTKADYHFVLVGDASQFVKTAFSSIWNMMTGKGIDFNIAGKLKAGVFIFRMKWAVDYTYKMSLDEFMSFF